MIRTRRLLSITAVCIVAAACGYDPTDIGVDPPPLLVREEGTVPVDATDNLFEVDGMPIVVNFNREFTADEIALVRFIPRPVYRGIALVPGSNRHQAVIDGVVLDPYHESYRLVIAGPAIPRPIMLTYYPGKRPEADGALEGRVINAWTGEAAHGVIVYALPSRWRADRPPMRLGEYVLFDNPVIGVATALAPESGVPAMYRMTGLIVGVRYLVVAISDLDRDGEYDLSEDWWGYHRDFEHDPIEIVAGLQATDSKAPAGPDMPVGVDISVLPPGSLPNPYSRLPDVRD